MISPRMTSRGKQIAAIVAILGVLALPKRVECGYPGATCRRAAAYGLSCVTYEYEPFVFYVIERLAGSDVGFAYTSGEDCR